MAPPGYVPQDHLLLPLIAQAKAAGVQKVVLMTAMGADAAPDTPLRKAELALEASGIAWNTVRPNWFMQNFHTFWLHGIREQGRILLPTGTARGSFIDARDIADVAAELLLGEAHMNQAFDLTGSEALNHDEVAAVLSTRDRPRHPLPRDSARGHVARPARCRSARAVCRVPGDDPGLLRRGLFRAPDRRGAAHHRPRPAQLRGLCARVPRELDRLKPL